MKKAIALCFLTVSLLGKAQQENTWRLGIQLGNLSNGSYLKGGSDKANARFEKGPYKAGAIAFHGRYDINKRWMLQFGLGIHSLGFGYTLAGDYSLYRPELRKNELKSEFGVIEIPVMAFYRFNPNCKNARWMLGAGLSEGFVGAQEVSASKGFASDGVAGTDFMSSTSSTKEGIHWNLRWSVAREKTFRNQSILNASVLVNIGLSQVATSTVNYSVDGQTYSHQFSNNGNFVGFRLTYYFRPISHPSSGAKRASGFK